MLNLGVDQKPGLSPETFVLLRDIIYAKCGIYFTETKKYLLETRLQRRLEVLNLRTFEDYYYLLMYDAGREREIVQLINSVVTNETSFFRDAPQIQAFAKGVVPRVMEDKGRAGMRSIRVWSAACSTGEEPYTLAMVLLDEGLGEKGWSLEILGSDISENVLGSAMKGCYERYALRNTPEDYLKRYFTSEGERYRVDKKVQDIVRYRRVNLVDSFETRLVKGMDVIFCRNVLIYFDDSSKKKVIGHLYDSLNKGGYLFVGFSESLHSVTRLFRPVSFDRTVVYQKF